MTKKILFICNHASFFLSHRYNLYEIAKLNQYEASILVGKAASSDDEESINILKNNKINFSIFDFHTSRINLIKEIKVLFKIYKHYKKTKPFIIHSISLKPILFSAILSKFYKTNYIFSFSGFGYLFINKNLKIFKYLYILLLKIFLSKNNSIFIVQNSNDYKFLIDKFNINKKKIFLIKGSGVNLNNFRSIRNLKKSNNITFLSRPLKSKGVIEFCESAKILKNKFPNWKFYIVGDINYKSPDIIDKKYLDFLIKSNIIEYKNYRKDVINIYKFSKVICLPSYREGLPKVLQEAQSSGIPVVTSDDPGCLAAIIPNKTGLVCKIGDVNSLKECIERLVTDSFLYKNMHLKCIDFSESNFDINVVSEIHLNIYKSLN